MADNYSAARNAHRPAPQAPNLFARRAASVFMGFLFLFHMSSFAPVSWIIQPDWKTELDGEHFVDRIISPIIGLGAIILHWYIAEAVEPFLLTVSVPKIGGDVQVQNGQLQMAHLTFPLGLWEPSYFWPAVVLEVAMMWAVWPVSGMIVSELVRRSVLVGIFGSVWFVGWNSLPYYRKEFLYRLMKEYFIQLVISEMINSAFGRRQRRRR
ncbi:hypothetical protein N0V93_008662 [Gnomoniopsis smithogilvyi]|uniref:Uncharacterized protein n=1 Tax=Gnomoniopsis smithogilvyi TaxID=1191159 RepID=A0A9W8YME8_9PEZI|nr:hypothetical protein N0V93_008662 [Gnomoniopsis smithogilvyi]